MANVTVNKPETKYHYFGCTHVLIDLVAVIWSLFHISEIVTFLNHLVH